MLKEGADLHPNNFNKDIVIEISVQWMPTFQNRRAGEPEGSILSMEQIS